MNEDEECFSCGIIHPKVEAKGIWHCPNALCRGCGAAWFRNELNSFIDNKDGTHSVCEDEWKKKGKEYNKKNGIKLCAQTVK